MLDNIGNPFIKKIKVGNLKYTVKFKFYLIFDNLFQKTFPNVDFNYFKKQQLKFKLSCNYLLYFDSKICKISINSFSK